MAEANQSLAPTAPTVSLTQNLPDVWLRLLVELVNQTGAEIPLTLTVGGILVSGILVARKSYVEHLRTAISSVCKDEELVKTYQSECDKALKRPASPASQKYPLLPHAITLKNVRYLLPGHKPNSGSNVAWWRGLISEVDGFSLGQLDED